MWKKIAFMLLQKMADQTSINLDFRKGFFKKDLDFLSEYVDFVDFKYDSYCMISLFKCMQIKNLTFKYYYFSLLGIIFNSQKFGKKQSIKYQSKSTKVDAFGQKTWQNPLITYNNNKYY